MPWICLIYDTCHEHGDDSTANLGTGRYDEGVCHARPGAHGVHPKGGAHRGTGRCHREDDTRAHLHVGLAHGARSARTARSDDARPRSRRRRSPRRFGGAPVQARGSRRRRRHHTGMGIDGSAKRLPVAVLRRTRRLEVRKHETWRSSPMASRPSKPSIAPT
jgi:hypothetical protein